MARTSLKAKKKIRNKRGFTLIELTIVIALIVMFAIAVAPNVLAQRRSVAVRSFFLGIRRIVSEAREAAVTQKATVYLTYDEGSNRLVVSRASTQEDSEQRQEFASLDVPDEIEPSDFRVAQADANAADWSVAFYADGTSDGGSLQLDSGEDGRSLTITSAGYALVANGETPDPATEKWEAGSYEQRL
jgi:prepilin-type N-terminal cleavage/methylation domain-containing protein